MDEMEELAYQRWEGERIAEEMFFYDPAPTGAQEGLVAGWRTLRPASDRNHGVPPKYFDRRVSIRGGHVRP
jgi:hypothetical protein